MLLRCVLIALLAGGSICKAQTIARNPLTGKTYPLKQWIHALPDTFDLFSDSRPMQIRLKADFSELVSNKFSEDKRDAGLYYLLNDTLEIYKEIRIQPRGNFRKQNCTFPPLHLDFKKTTFYVPQAHSFEKMKLVTECVREKRFETYLLREYLIYRLYNQLTPLSFNVRLLKVTYQDTGGRFDDNSAFAFIIEDIDDLAKRNGGTELDSAVITPEMIRSRDLLLFTVFQYMIGNQDWSVAGFKNVKIIQYGDTGELRAIPYDFDYSGFVNTHYAEPKRHLGLNTIRDRYFLGMCYSEEEISQVLELFLSRKETMREEVRSFSYLDQAAREDLVAYLDTFFDQIERKNGWRYFSDHCKEP